MINLIEENQYEIDRIIDLAIKLNTENEKIYFTGSGAAIYREKIEKNNNFIVINNNSGTIRSYDLCRISVKDTHGKSYCTSFEYVPDYINKSQAERMKENV